MVTAAEIVEFASRWDPLPFHLDEVWARESAVGGLIASGAHTMAIFQRLAVDAAWSHFALVMGRSITELRMLAPVRPGMTLTGRMRWTEIVLRPSGRARVGYRGELFADGATPVWQMTADVVVAQRAAPP